MDAVWGFFRGDYVGLVPGSTPTTTLARQRYEEKLSNTALLQPTQREVEQALANVDTSSPLQNSPNTPNQPMWACVPRSQ
ncbi:hypothetical protein ACQEPT_003185 [Xanthomonas oryzae pv. oryzicola]|uniref:hypothetical protein n=1 Tax=Xanthomonas oryzae TaxID=347 RepID=UPI003D9FC581